MPQFGRLCVRWVQSVSPAFLILGLAVAATAQETTIPDEVLDIFDARCAFAGCHAGSNPTGELDLSEEFAYASLVNQPSSGKSGALRVKPGNPAESYILMKLKGSPGIEGERMPRGSEPLSAEQIATIERWIASLPEETQAVEAPEREYVQAFPGLSVATLPTAQTLDPGVFSYRVAHRWRGDVVEAGFADFFGLDAGAHMLTQLTFPIIENITVYVARSTEKATFEFAGKWRFLREKTDGSVPLSAAVVVGFDWETRKQLPGVGEISRTNRERFHQFVQLALSKQVTERISVLLVPGILFNGNVTVTDEDPILTVGYAAKFMIFDGFSVFIEGIPILSGSEDALTVGGPRPDDEEFVFNDAVTLGFERRIGGHVFHVYITNSLALTTDQYMSGGNFDLLDGEFRLGFNIYRILRLPF